MNWARPTLSSAATFGDGTEVLLTFSENLDPGGRSITLFTVKVDGTAVTLSGTVATVSGRVVTLTLATALTSATQVVTVSYADPTAGDDAGGVQDLAGNDADSFTDQAVTNAFGSAATLTVTGVEITSTSLNGFNLNGVRIQVDVTFSAAVDITGSPQLELDFDGAPKAATCAAATNTTTMVCRYTIGGTDSAPDGIAIAANKLTLNGGTITATGSTTINANLDHAAVAIDAGQKVDGIRPTLVTTGADAPRTSTDGTKVILTFSETLSQVDDRTLITIMSGTNTLSTTAASLTGTDQTTVELTLTTALTASATNLTVALAVDAVSDAPGNGNGTISATPVINAVGATPTVTGVEFFSNPTGNVYAIDDIVEVAVRFSNIVDITGAPQLELDFAGTPKTATCEADTATLAMLCSYEVVAGDSAPNGVAIAANKLTLNGGAITATGSTTAVDLDHAAVAIDAGHKVDGIRPTLVTTGSDAPRTSTDGTQVRLTFSEDIGSVDRTFIAIFYGGGDTIVPTSDDSFSGRTVEITLATALTDSIPEPRSGSRGWRRPRRRRQRQRPTSSRPP